ncbi:MAG: hypothetical protein H6712_00300 [Myxococcales bacterium]|nr:hypothetical protein [Myxococcales bacterium]
MDRVLPVVAWVVVALQAAGFVRVYLVSRREHAHVPEAFIELHIVAGLCVLAAIGSLWGAKLGPSPAWWVVRGLTLLALLLLAGGHLRDRL